MHDLKTETQTAYMDIIKCLLNRAAVGWAVSCSAFGFFFFNRAAEGGRGSRTAFGFLTALPKAGAVLELPSVF